MSFNKVQIELGAQRPVFVAVTVPDSVLDGEPARFAGDTALMGSVGMAYTPSRVDAAHMAEFADQAAVLETATRARGKKPDAAGYDCLSASVVGDDAGVRSALAAGAGVQERFAITPISALIAAFEAVGARRLWLASPYDLTLSEAVGNLLRHNGFETNGSYADLSEGIFRVPPQAVRELALGARRGGADAVALLCTNLRTFGVIEGLEQELKVPVISAHSAFTWAGVSAAYRACGETRRPEFGPSLGRLGQVPWPGNPRRILKP